MPTNIFHNVIILCLVSAGCGAIVNILARKILIRPEYGTEDFLPLNFGISTMMLMLLFPWFWQFSAGPTTWTWMFAMLFCSFFTNWVCFRGASQVRASTYSLVVAFAPVATALLMAVTGHENNLSSFGFLGIGGIILGLAVVSWGNRNHAAGNGWKLLLYPIIGMLLMGVQTFLDRNFLVSGNISSYSYLFIRYSFLALSMLLIFRLKYWRECLRTSWRTILIRCTAVIVQWWTLAQALLISNSPVLVSSLSTSAPILVVGISLISGFEKPRKTELLGITIATLGIMALIYFH